MDTRRRKGYPVDLEEASLLSLWTCAIDSNKCIPRPSLHPSWQAVHSLREGYHNFEAGVRCSVGSAMSFAARRVRSSIEG
jgi:hypothetical protein